MYQFLCLTTLLLGYQVNPLEVWDTIVAQHRVQHAGDG
jgi:hypothetical protein